MYAYIKGTLAGAGAHHAVIDVGGIGFRLSLSTLDAAKLPRIGEAVHLHTTLIIRENEQTLYGFLHEEGRSLFELLITISGIGPKTAIALLGTLSLNLLHQAIAEEDPRLLSKVPGIGKKTAERLLIELRDKLPDPPAYQRVSSNVEDAISALLNLGYSRARAQRALEGPLKELGEGADLPTLITAALKSI
ncbi:MAG: Holliday junction branch migration protein RuvA [Parachlamydiales bacterium]